MIQNELTTLLSSLIPRLLHPEEVSKLTHFSVDVELPAIAKKGYLRPLGWPLPNSAKRLYSMKEVIAFLNDTPRLEKARHVALLAHRNKRLRFKQPKDGAKTDSI